MSMKTMYTSPDEKANDSITKSWRRFMPLASSIAEENRESILKLSAHAIVALVIDKGTPILHGTNQRRSVRELSYYGDALHAEADLIRKSSTDQLNGASIYLYRFGAKPNSKQHIESACAKPCRFCCHLLRKQNISKVAFISNEGEIRLIKRRNLMALSENPARYTHAYLNKKSSANNTFSDDDVKRIMMSDL